MSDTIESRNMRLEPDAKNFEVWVSNPQLRGIYGIAFLEDGMLYFNNFFNGKLSRVSINSDGSASPIQDTETSIQFRQPGGMRTLGPNKLVHVEGSGRLTEITINEDTAEVKVLKEGLTRATGVTLVGSKMLVLVERSRAVVVTSE